MDGSVSSIVVASVGRQVLEGIFESLHFRQILHKYGFTVLCHLGMCDEDHCRGFGRSLPPGQVGSGATWPQAQGPRRGRVAARTRNATPIASAPEPGRVD